VSAVAVGDGWIDQGERWQRRPAAHALAPRWRKPRERFGRHAREAACCLRMAFVRGRTIRALRGGSGKLPVRTVPAGFAGGNSASAFGGTPARWRAAGVRR
jgi:hypothetical protein